jgi:cardiolipin synthase A/B
MTFPFTLHHFSLLYANLLASPIVLASGEVWVRADARPPGGLQLPSPRPANILPTMLTEAAVDWTWLCSGREIFPAMLAAIDAAQHSVCLEIYIFASGHPGESIREALVRARQRGAAVQVLIDAFGSMGLAAAFWKPLRAAGAEVRFFNPLWLGRLGIRNHRKLLVCDGRVAFVGGFNVAPEYDGDGVAHGWFDVGLKVGGPLPAQLAASFREMFERADFQHKRFVRLRKSLSRKLLLTPNEVLLLSGPGRGPNPLTRALRADLARASSVQIMVAYFLPTWRIRRALARIARDGGNVELILPGKSDVLISQLAGQSLYRRLLRAGVRIYEYQPQVLHAKLMIIDDFVYAGSANLDPRSLNINYELMIRFNQRAMADEARKLFAERLPYCRQIRLEEWRKSRTVWRRLKQRWAYWLLVRIDPYLARRQWRALPD